MSERCFDSCELQILGVKYPGWCSLGACPSLISFWLLKGQEERAFWQPSSHRMQGVGDNGLVAVAGQCQCPTEGLVCQGTALELSVCHRSWDWAEGSLTSPVNLHWCTATSPLLIFVVFPSKQTQFCSPWIVISSPPTYMVSITALLELLSLSSFFFLIMPPRLVFLILQLENCHREPMGNRPVIPHELCFALVLSKTL